MCLYISGCGKLGFQTLREAFLEIVFLEGSLCGDDGGGVGDGAYGIYAPSQHHRTLNLFFNLAASFHNSYCADVYIW